MAGTALGMLHTFSQPVLRPNLSGCYYPHFTDGETEATTALSTLSKVILWQM